MKFFQILLFATFVRFSNEELIRTSQVYEGVISTLHKYYNATNLFLVYGVDSANGKKLLICGNNPFNENY